LNTAKSRIGDGGECRWGHIDVGCVASGAAVGDGQLDTFALECDSDLVTADRVVVGVPTIVARECVKQEM
jgi:hypothetical protein